MKRTLGRKAARAAQLALMRSMRVTRRLVRPRRKEPGAAPGTLVHTGPRRVDKTVMHLLRYSPQTFEESNVISPDECFPSRGDGTVTWLNVDGLHDTERLADLGRLAGLHPLVLEDIVSIGQRPKQEAYDGQHYLVLRMLNFDREKRLIEEEQISIIVGRDYVISFQEAPGNVWDPIRDRLRTGKGQARQRGADYLAYALMDAIVDEYFAVVETVGDELERLEAEVMEAPLRSTIAHIHHLKGELLILRKAVWPLRDVFNSLIRDESELFADATKFFLRDAYDHAVQVIDTVETMRDVTAGLIDLYLSSVSNKNERDHEGADADRHTVHSADVPGGRVRHELPLHAGTADAVGLPHAVGDHARDRSVHDHLVQAEILALMGRPR